MYSIQGILMSSKWHPEQQERSRDSVQGMDTNTMQSSEISGLLATKLFLPFCF